MPESISAIPFLVLAVAVVLGASMVVLSKNVVHAAFWVLEVMMAVAGLFMLLSAGFLALVQVMVYAGAVSVLLLFTVMLTLRNREDAIRSRDLSWSAGAIAIAVAVAASTAIVSFKPPVPQHARRHTRRRRVRPPALLGMGAALRDRLGHPAHRARRRRMVVGG